jgi:hypothetical protein
VIWYVAHLCVVVFTYLDVEVLAVDSPNKPQQFIMTLPNTSYIPLHRLHNPEALCLRADGHFGLKDCFQYPQAFSEKHPWATCITCKPMEQDLLSRIYTALWATPTKTSFVLEKGCAFANMGRLEKLVVDVLQTIQRNLTEHLQKYQELHCWILKNTLVMDFSMKSTLMCLHGCPMTFAMWSPSLLISSELVWISKPSLITLEPMSSTYKCLNLLQHDMSIMGVFTSNLEVTKCLNVAFPYGLFTPTSSFCQTSKSSASYLTPLHQGTLSPTISMTSKWASVTPFHLFTIALVAQIGMTKPNC